MSLPFGSTPKTAASGFTLPPNPTTTAGGSFQASGSGDTTLQAKPSSTLFAATSTTSTPTFSLGSPFAKTSTISFGSAATSTGVASLTTATAVSSSISTPQVFGLSTDAGLLKTSQATSVGGTAATTTASVSKLAFGLPSVSVTSAPSAVVAITTTTSAIPTSSALTFAQLEDSINKWTIDLEEQGKFFINQAKQLNAWDSLLISNSEKIFNLNNSIERVKQQQQQLDQELDFILAQQKELEELIVPLEKELVELPVTDIDRNQMYQFSEIIDSQLKQMSDDLKEIIEHINESSKDEEISNPVTQISRILNAHMNSLQWIDRNTAQISTQLEQLHKLEESNRRNFALDNSLG